MADDSRESYWYHAESCHRGRTDGPRPSTRCRRATCLGENSARAAQVLDGESVSTILYVPYLGFGRQLWKLSREQDIAGDSLQLAAEALRLKWKARGLDDEVLLAIQREVCSVQPEP